MHNTKRKNGKFCHIFESDCQVWNWFRSHWKCHALAITLPHESNSLWIIIIKGTSHTSVNSTDGFLAGFIFKKSNSQGHIENTIFGKVTVKDTLGNKRENIYQNSMSINKWEVVSSYWRATLRNMSLSFFGLHCIGLTLAEMSPEFSRD